MSVKQVGPNEAEDERILVRRARDGNANAFGELYERHLDRVYRYVFYRVGSPVEAEDLTEQVFLKAWEAIARYDDRGLPFTAWLYRMAHNLVIDYYRTRRPDVALDEALDRAAQDDPSAETEANLEAAEVRAAIGDLNPEQQQVLILRFIEGLGHDQVATILGKTEGATRVLQHRALAALARALERRQGGNTVAYRERAR